MPEPQGNAIKRKIQGLPTLFPAGHGTMGRDQCTKSLSVSLFLFRHLLTSSHQPNPAASVTQADGGILLIPQNLHLFLKLCRLMEFVERHNVNSMI